MQMKIIRHEIENKNIFEIVSDDIILNDVQDALDLMANTGSLKYRKLIIHEKNITPDFFDLNTKLAGEVLQKFTNYNVKLAIVGNFDKYRSKSLKAFINESNSGIHINFVNDINSALK